MGELEAAVATYPFQEGLWELLITALYRAGRQADALAAHQRVRTRLADELGLEPGPRLQELERQILNHDPGLRLPDRHAQAGNLPSLSSELVGRDERDRRPLRAARQQAPRRGRRARGHREDGGRHRDRARAVRRARRRLAGPARSRADGGRRPRYGDRRAARHRRRGGAVRAAQARRRGGDPRQLRARHPCGRGAGGAPPRRRPRAPDPLHEPGRARHRRRGRARARAAFALRRRGAVHPSRRPARRHERGARPVPVARRPAARDRACRGAHQDAVRRGDRAVASTIASAC